MRIDEKVKKSGDQAKFVDRSKTWKHCHLFGQLPVLKRIKFLQLNCSQLYYGIKQYQPQNCDWFQVNKNHPSEKTDRKNMIDGPKYFI